MDLRGDAENGLIRVTVRSERAVAIVAYVFAASRLRVTPPFVVGAPGLWLTGHAAGRQEEGNGAAR